ncbi:MAG TPA: thioredoxin domain-containing protein [Candidatus Nanopelagicaceae bacterium]|nr:thioredoxin domain-containing protein [Candidatus Nanopelagicaceae bacterium]
MNPINENNGVREKSDGANKPNKLITEKSPYLLQHANNPVEWYAWGEEAFEKAKSEDKPIFLSIGYSTCHWCHVMAHESFEDPYVAKLLNEAFISIKVDREERPDIDKIYMTVCQLMTGSGGWPLTIIMTPDKKPFFAGTYFPKETRFGRTGLVDLAKRVKNLWINERKQLVESSEKITFALQDANTESPGRSLAESVLKSTYSQLSGRFDKKNGGFGTAPKFPTPHNLLFLLRFWRRTGDEEALKMVEKTLKAMRMGGIYDHIGFGFHRYSTDPNWLVPHFEKMLYDQALLILVYLEAYQATGKEEYANTAKEVLTYILRDMISSEGAFYSAEDADSEGEEGKFYVWSKGEIEEILGVEEAEVFSKLYNIDINGNFFDEATKSKTGKNIIHLKSYLSDTPTIDIELIRNKLFEAREKRIKPHKDDKVLTDWNGLMIAAFAKAGYIFNEPKYIQVAEKAVDFILNQIKNSEGRLLHRYRKGGADILAFLDDYAFLVWGLINLYEASFETRYLEKAIKLTEEQLKLFWDFLIGAFFFTAEDAESLLTRQKETYDGAIPSGNSVAMLNLLRLAQLTGNDTYEKKADHLGRVFAESVRANPVAHSLMMVAVDYAVGPTYSLVIAGDEGKDDTNSMLDEVRKQFLPNKSLIFRPTEKVNPEIDNLSNYIQFFDKYEGKATAYVCINKTCKTPTNDITKALEYLSSRE